MARAQEEGAATAGSPAEAQQPPVPVTVTVDGRTVRLVTRVLAAAVAVLALLNVLALALRYGVAGGTSWSWLELLDLNRESSLGTWVAGTLLTVLALVCLACGLQERRRGGRWERNWALLAVAFAYVSIDEVLAVHERVAPPVREALDLDGALYFAWTLPALVLVAVFGLVQLGFLTALPRTTRTRLLAAAGLFLTGAVGLELVESAVFTAAGNEFTLTFDGLSAVEEVLELSAVVLALRALLLHVVDRQTAVVLPATGALRRL